MAKTTKAKQQIWVVRAKGNGAYVTIYSNKPTYVTDSFWNDSCWEGHYIEEMCYAGWRKATGIVLSLNTPTRISVRAWKKRP